jgi:GDP-L-fucose synthase
MIYYSGESHINIGSGEDITVLELATAIKAVVGFGGNIELDPSMPDGTPRKLLDISTLRRMGWAPRISLSEGLKSTYAWYDQNREVRSA